jgi:hypothetical protein
MIWCVDQRLEGGELRGKAKDEQRKELCCHVGVPTSVKFTFFMILHLFL